MEAEPRPKSLMNICIIGVKFLHSFWGAFLYKSEMGTKGVCLSQRLFYLFSSIFPPLYYICHL